MSEVQNFGGEYLCQQILDKLPLADCLKGCGLTDHQVNKTLIAIVACALFTASGHKTSQILSTHSSLQSLYNHRDFISHKALYAIGDQLYAHQETIGNFLDRRLTGVFNLEDKLVIFDISSTYFETSKPTSTLTKHGRSKEKRSDCPLVVFTAVANAQDFLKHSRVYEGNKAYMTSWEDILADLEANTGWLAAKKTVVMDAGIASDENLQLIKTKGYHYVFVSRHRIKDYAVESDQQVTQWTDKGNQQVKLKVFQPEGYDDTRMYIQSDEK